MRGKKYRELGVLNFELGIVLGFACDCELFNLELGITSFYELGVLNFELGIVLGFACDLELNN